MRCQLVRRDGFIFVLHHDSDECEPWEYFAFYPTGIRECGFVANYGVPETLELQDVRDGEYIARDPKHPVFKLRIRLTEGGQTTPKYWHKVSAPCPKVRRGTEVRWHHGHWEKFVKSKGGWIAIEYVSERCQAKRAS